MSAKPICPLCKSDFHVTETTTGNKYRYFCAFCNVVVYQCTPAARHNPIDHPSHYTNHPSGVECITVTEHLSFCIGNAIKYLWRYDRKNGVEDLKKAIWYIQREISRLEKVSSEKTSEAAPSKET